MTATTIPFPLLDELGLIADDVASDLLMRTWLDIRDPRAVESSARQLAAILYDLHFDDGGRYVDIVTDLAVMLVDDATSELLADC